MKVGYVLFQCPFCGKLEQISLVSTAAYPQQCTHGKFVYVMNQIGGWNPPREEDFLSDSAEGKKTL